MTSDNPKDWNSGWYFAASADEIEAGKDCRVQVEGTALNLSLDGDSYRASDGRREWPVMLVDGDIYVYAGDAVDE